MMHLLFFTIDSTTVPVQSRVEALDPESGEIQTLLSIDATNAYVALSPQGDRLAYAVEKVSGGRKLSIHLVDIASGEDHEVASSGVYMLSMLAPVWSPDGSRFAYFTGNEKKWSIGMTEAATLQSTILDSSVSPYLPPQWSPDSNLLLIYSQAVPRKAVVLSADGSKPERILLPQIHYPKMTHASYGWIPGTHDLLLAPMDNHGVHPIEWWRINADTSDATPVPVLGSSVDLAEFLNEETLLSIGYDNSNAYLRQINLHGASEVPSLLLGERVYYAQLFLSPDRTQAAVLVRRRRSRVNLIKLIDLASWTIIREISAVPVIDARWMPDGTQLFYLALPYKGELGFFITTESKTSRHLTNVIGSILGWTTFVAS